MAGSVEDKGYISQLQEFIQSSPDWKAPPNQRVLSWAFDERKGKRGQTEYRATVALSLDGIPHHMAGKWLNSKTDAKRDLAYRVLCLLVTEWSGQLQGHHVVQPRRHSATQAGRSAEEQMKELDVLLRASQSPGDAEPKWTFEWSAKEHPSQCQAIVEVTLLGTIHKFIGQRQNSKAAAKLDTAKRTAWYLQFPGYEEEFEIDPKTAAQEPGKPPENWLQGVRAS